MSSPRERGDVFELVDEPDEPDFVVHPEEVETSVPYDYMVKLRIAAKAELENMKKMYPARFFIPNIGQEKAMQPFKQHNGTELGVPFISVFGGGNGVGKTTLAAVLHSLTLNQSEIIAKRISTDHTTPQTAQWLFSLPTFPVSLLAATRDIYTFTGIPSKHGKIAEVLFSLLFSRSGFRPFAFHTGYATATASG